MIGKLGILTGRMKNNITYNAKLLAYKAKALLYPYLH